MIDLQVAHFHGLNGGLHVRACHPNISGLNESETSLGFPVLYLTRP